MKLINNFISYVCVVETFFVFLSLFWAEFSKLVGFVQLLLPPAYEVNACKYNHHNCKDTSTDQFVLGHGDLFDVGVGGLDVHVFEGDADSVILLAS